MLQGLGGFSTATTIGMASMGCLSSEGQPKCPKLGQCCNGSRAMACMGEAIANFPEAKAEILLAGLAVVSKSAKNIIEVRRFIPRMEMTIQTSI